MASLAAAGETHLILSLAEKQLALDALVVDDLDVDILAGTSFRLPMTLPSVPQSATYVFKTLKSVIHYEPTDIATFVSPAVRRAQSFTLRSPSSAKVPPPFLYNMES